MNLQCTILRFCMVIVFVGGTGTYFLPDLRTESGSTVFNMSLRAGIAVPFQVSDLTSQEPGVLYMRPGDVYAFSFPSPLANNSVLEMHMGVTTKPCRFQIADATGAVMMDLNWLTDEYDDSEVRYASTSNMMLPMAGFDTSKFYVKVLDYPTWPQWRDEYFTFLGTLVSAWETDTTEASEQVTLIRMAEDVSDCFVDDTFRLGPTDRTRYQGFPSTLPTKYFVANVSTCKLNLSSSLATHQGSLASSTYIQFNGFRLQSFKGRIKLKSDSHTTLYTMEANKQGEEMMAMTFRVPTQWLQQMSGYYIELEKMFLSPYIKLKGSGPQSRVMNLANASVSGNMEMSNEATLSDDDIDASSVTYENSLGGQQPFTGEMRRRRTADVPVAKRSGTLTFNLEATDLMDRPFMNILWWEPGPSHPTFVSLTDSAGKHFLKYEYPGSENNYGPSWETTFSLLGVAPGETNLTIYLGRTYQFDPFFTLFKLPGVPKPIGDYNMSCSFASQLPAHGGLGTYYLPNLQEAAGSTQFCMVARGGVSFPLQMSDLTSQDPGVLYMVPGDIYAFAFPTLLGNTAVLELNLGISGKASRFQVTDGSDSLMADLNWLPEESGEMDGEGFYSLSTIMIPVAGFDTSKFHVKVLEYPDWPTWNSQYFAFLGTLVSVWEMDTTEAAEQVTLIKLPEQQNIDCIVDATYVNPGTNRRSHAGFNSLLPARYFVANSSVGTCNYNLSASLASFGTAMMESTYLEFNGFRVMDQVMVMKIKSVDDVDLYEFYADDEDHEMAAFTFRVPTAWLRNASAAGYYMTLNDCYLSPFVKLKGSGHRSRVIDLSGSAAVAGTMEKVTDPVPVCEDACARYSDPLGSWTLAGQMRRRRSSQVPAHETSGTVTFRLEEEDLGYSTFMEICWLQSHGESHRKVWLSDSAGNNFLKTEYTQAKSDQGTSWKTIVSLLGVAPGEVNLTVADDTGYQFYPYITLYRLNHTTSTTTTSTSTMSTSTTSTSTTSTATTATTTTRTTSTRTTSTATTATSTATTATSTATTLPAPPAPGSPLNVLSTSMSVTTTNCTEAKQMAVSQIFCDACAISMAGLLRLHSRHVSSTCSVGGSCSRRLLGLQNSLTRNLAGLPAIRVDYRIEVPASQSSSMMVSLNSVAPSALQSSITASLVGTVFQGSVNSVTALSQPTTSVSFVAFECHHEQGCLFDSYEIDNHYKIHKTTLNSTECAKACYDDQACEAFESLPENIMPYTCAFWMHGACNIETAGSKAPGFVTAGPGVLFCDKNNSRNPWAASNSHMLGLKAVLYLMILVVCISREP